FWYHIGQLQVRRRRGERRQPRAERGALISHQTKQLVNQRASLEGAGLSRDLLGFLQRFYRLLRIASFSRFSALIDQLCRPQGALPPNSPPAARPLNPFDRAPGRIPLARLRERGRPQRRQTDRDNRRRNPRLAARKHATLFAHFRSIGWRNFGL